MGTETGPYTMESRVAARDATPAVTVAAASNFCPVPPLIFVDGPGAWNGGTGCVYYVKNLPPSGSAERVVGVTGPQRGVVDDDARNAQSRASKARDGQGYLTRPNRLGPAADRARSLLVDMLRAHGPQQFPGACPSRLTPSPAACAVADPCHPPALLVIFAICTRAVRDSHLESMEKQMA